MQPHPDGQWQMDDYALATEARIVTFDPWATDPQSADPVQRTSCEGPEDAPVLATPALPPHEKGGPQKTEAETSCPHVPLRPKRDGLVQHWPEAAHSTTAARNRLMPDAPLDHPSDETWSAFPFAPVGADEPVDEEWEELERAEGAAITRGIETAPDEEKLIAAIESPGEADSARDGAYVNEDELGGIGEWDEPLDGPVIIEAMDNFDTNLPSRSDWSGDVDDYDPTAQQDVWKQRPEDSDQALTRARAKAARIVSLLDVVRPAERDSVLGVLVELFSHLEHPRTFEAIEALALQGISPELLRSVIALRRCWLEHPEWWVGRYGWGCTVTPLRDGAGALSWRLARCICEARAEFPPEQMIDADWFEEWLELRPFEQGFFSYPEYLHWKCNMWSAELLFVGLQTEARRANPEEFADPIGWYRRLTTAALIGNVIVQGPPPLWERPPPRTG